jgi:nucleoside-diphosphate-sugar epimerase
MEEVSLFGKGFIGSWYEDMAPCRVNVMEKNWLRADDPNILYTISTVHNYHAKEGEPFLDIETNLLYFMKVLETNHLNWQERMVFNLVSTWFVYGNTELPAKETSPCNPTGFYSITARAREQLLISYCETFGLKYRILRLGNVIGAGDKKVSRKKNALQYMVSEIAKGNDVDYLYKNGAIRDYIDVRDCVDAIHLVLEKGELSQIYNIANGQGLNVNDLVNVAWAESGYLSKITEIPVPEFHRKVQTPKMWMDVSKLKKLGYVQKHDIKNSVRELVHHYQNETQKQNT